MANHILLILPMLLWMSGGILLQVFNVSAAKQERALETDERPVKVNNQSTASDSSHHLNISSKTVVANARMRQNHLINTLLKKQQTWSNVQLRSRIWDGMKISDDSQPQFKCDSESLILRFPVARHTQLFLLSDSSPINIQHLPAHCRHTAEKQGPWILFKVFFNGCYIHHKFKEWMQLYSVTVQFFDQVLMQNVTAAATCLAATPSHAASKAEVPVVKCEKGEVMVKLPGRLLKQVLVSDLHLAQEKDVRQWTNNTFLYVKMNIEKDQTLTLIYLDLIGKLKKVEVSCIQKHWLRPRTSAYEIYGDGISDLSYDPHILTDISSETGSTNSFTATSTDTEPLSTNPFEEFGHFGEFWGFQGIPTGTFKPPEVTETPVATTESFATTTSEVTSGPITTLTAPTTSMPASFAATTSSADTTIAAMSTPVPTTTSADPTTVATMTTPVTTTLADITTVAASTTVASKTTPVPSTRLADTTTVAAMTTKADTTTVAAMTTPVPTTTLADPTTVATMTTPVTATLADTTTVAATTTPVPPTRLADTTTVATMTTKAGITTVAAMTPAPPTRLRDTTTVAAMTTPVPTTTSADPTTVATMTTPVTITLADITTVAASTTVAAMTTPVPTTRLADTTTVAAMTTKADITTVAAMTTPVTATLADTTTVSAITTPLSTTAFADTTTVAAMTTPVTTTILADTTTVAVMTTPIPTMAFADTTTVAAMTTPAPTTTLADTTTVTATTTKTLDTTTLAATTTPSPLITTLNPTAVAGGTSSTLCEMILNALYNNSVSNLSSPEYRQLAQHLEKELAPFFAQVFPSFLSVEVQRFRIIADLKILFNTTSPPDVASLGSVIQTAKDSGNLAVDIMSFAFPDTTTAAPAAITAIPTTTVP